MEGIRWLALRRGGVVAAAALAIASSAMGAIEGLQGQLHVEGAPGGRVVDMWFSLLEPEGPKLDRPADVICGWHAFEIAATGAGEPSGECAANAAVVLVTSNDALPAEALPECTKENFREGCAVANGRLLAHTYLWFDILLFCPAYTFLLVGLWRRRGGDGGDRVVGPRAAIERFRGSRFVLAAAIGAFVADEAENLLTLSLINRTWSGASRLLPASVSGDAVALLIWLFGVVKWSLVVVALIPTLFAALMWLHERRTLIFRLLPVVVLAVVPFAVLQHPQGADAVRRWGGGQYWATLALTAMMCAASAALSFKVSSGLLQADEIRVKGDTVRGWLMIGIGVLFGATGLVIVNVSKWLPGVGALLLLVGLGYLLSGPIELSAATSEPSNGETEPSANPDAPLPPLKDRASRPAVVAALIGVLPLVAVFAPVVAATAGEAFYFRFADFGAWLRGGPGEAFIRACFVLVVGIPVIATLAIHAATRRRGVGATVNTLWSRSTVRLPVRIGVPVLALGWVLFVASRRRFQVGDAHHLGAVAMLVSFLLVLVISLSVATEVSDLILRIQKPPDDATSPSDAPAERNDHVAGAVMVDSERTSAARHRRDLWGPWTFPAAVRLAGWRRPPVVAGVVAWALLAAIADPGSYHAARQGSTLNEATTGFTLEEYAIAWYGRRIEHAATADRAAVTPIVMVAASGGGIRAAYWTTAVLDCIINRERVDDDPCGAPADDEVRERRLREVFALSGISGSSLGLVTFAAGAIEDPAGTGAGDRIPVMGADGKPLWSHHLWYQDLLNDDFLTPTLSRWLFNDVPNVWLRRGSDADCMGESEGACDGDRAAALELAWEDAWNGVASSNPLSAGFVSWQTSGGEPHLPLLILNSYSVEDGCRFNVSVLQSNGPRGPEQCRVLFDELAGETSPESGRSAMLDATTDLVDFTSCDIRMRDLPVSTAALLSARFPFVTPSGMVEGCGGISYLVDGGYRDTSAASTLVELWPQLHDQLTDSADDFPVTGLQPIFIQIDNGYSQTAAPQTDSRPNELLVPSNARAEAMGGIANASRQAAERTFGCFIRITTHAHPGSQAPLGWVLSDSSEASLQAQLIANGPTIDRVRDLMDGHFADMDPDACSAQ